MINAQRQHIDQYYATPLEVARKALQGVDLKGIKAVLDPSCGTGSFLAALPLSRSKYYGFEIDQDRHNSAKGRDYGHNTSVTMLGYDFLDQSQGIAPIIDLVVMNPPFNKGAEHFLRAYDLMMMQPKQSTIVCLLNQGTIDNPCTVNRRRLAHVIELHGGQVENFGKCFPKVSAEVACIKMTVPGRAIDRDWSGVIDWEAWETLQDQQADAKTALVPYTQGIGIAKDELLLMVDAYNATVKAHSDYVLLYQDLDKYTAICTGKQGYLEGWRGQGLNMDFNDWRSEFTKNTWLNLLDRCTHSAYMTKSVRDDITKAFTDGHAGLAFTLKNIENLFWAVLNMRPKLIEDTVKQAFDYLTLHANGYGKEYRHNRQFRMDSKFIVSWCLEKGYSKYSIKYTKRDDLDSIDKMLCLLSGMRYEDIKPVVTTVVDAINDGFPPRGKHPQGIDTTFFKVLWFKNNNLKFWVKEHAAPYWLEANRIIGKLKGQPLSDGSDWKAKHEWAPNQ